MASHENNIISEDELAIETVIQTIFNQYDSSKKGKMNKEDA